MTWLLPSRLLWRLLARAFLLEAVTVAELTARNYYRVRGTLEAHSPLPVRMIYIVCEYLHQTHQWIISGRPGIPMDRRIRHRRRLNRRNHRGETTEQRNVRRRTE